ncbi:HIRAN domain-containing protein [Brevibacillus sp. VP]|uniref:HIRAN domain-containing protein n=1 Tax=unclassified Brevibacillus TaxID=2684853 RepID=UPI000E2EAF72|nr:HIRAN domain-containing protein [Brevibacillus sp. VP]RFB34022.1 hypothetical protein DZB91_12265 [Brevibacillus sp. VP]
MGFISNILSIFGKKTRANADENVVNNFSEDYTDYEEWELLAVGVTFDNEDGTNRQTVLKRCNPGEEITLKRNTSKKYPNAVEIWSKHGQIGHISEKDAAELAPLIDRGKHILAAIKKITGGTNDKPTYGCVLSLQIIHRR